MGHPFSLPLNSQMEPLRRVQFLFPCENINTVTDVQLLKGTLPTAVGQVVACVPVTQRTRVRSPVGTSFLGGVFPHL